jgi:pyruvate/2-oxoglutarate dehydrogenase complex dihydrolipoamide acyltransferase (E2) component
MKHPIIIPGIGLVEAVTIVEWTRGNGERVEAGEVIVVFETEKATEEIVAPAAGAVEILVQAGPDLIDAETILGYIDDVSE